MFRRCPNLFKHALVAALALGALGCSNMPFVKQNRAPTRIFLTDFSTAWTAEGQPD